jgi:ABC-2 type transport system ATP-binding protein
VSAAIEVRGLSKRFGSVLAVDDLSFEVAPGRVTGFLGPNGSGKTTTLRILLGLVTGSGGSATFGGRRYVDIERPVEHVGAVLEATSFHPNRRAEDHLKMVAIGAGVPLSRVEESLALVGLTEVARRRVGKFSLGMRQRLQLATALIGDPEILILDEPSNGLDPQGIQWLRSFIRHQASLGHAVLVSSHLLSEMEETVDDVVIVSHGRLVLQTTLADLASQAGTTTGLRIRTPELPRLTSVLDAIPVAYRQTGHDTLVIDRATPEWFGPLAAQHQIVLYELVHEKGRLEDVFLSLTQGFDAPDPNRVAGTP